MDNPHKFLEKAIPRPPTVYTALKSSYQDRGAKERLTQSGFLQDTSLSDHRQQVWYNPQEQKLLMNVSGTHTKHDILTDIKLAFGGFRALEKTKRAKDAKKTLAKAKLKYEPKQTTLAGHSLGGSIVQSIADPAQDKILAVDSGMPLFSKAKKGKQGSAIIRAPGDVISLFGRGQTTLKQGRKNPLYAHRLKRVKNVKLFV